MKNTPDSFKESIQKSCIYDTTQTKSDIKNKLEDAEKMKIMIFNLDEAISGIINPNTCPKCIHKKLNPAQISLNIKENKNPSGKPQKNLFARSLSFAARSEKSINSGSIVNQNDSTTSVIITNKPKFKENLSHSRTPLMSHSKNSTITATPINVGINLNLCKLCKEPMHKMLIMEIGKNGGKPIIAKYRIDPGQMQFELDLKKIMYSYDEHYRIILVCDCPISDIFKGIFR